MVVTTDGLTFGALSKILLRFRSFGHSFEWELCQLDRLSYETSQLPLSNAAECRSEHGPGTFAKELFTIFDKCRYSKGRFSDKDRFCGLQPGDMVFLHLRDARDEERQCFLFGVVPEVDKTEKRRASPQEIMTHRLLTLRTS